MHISFHHYKNDYSGQILHTGPSSQTIPVLLTLPGSCRHGQRVSFRKTSCLRAECFLPSYNPRIVSLNQHICYVFFLGFFKLINEKQMFKRRRKKTNPWQALTMVTAAALLPLLPPDVSFADQMSDLGSDADASRGSAEPAVKRERVEISLPLQEM